MGKIIVYLNLMTGLIAQNSYLIPFDWGGQNGMIITDGSLFWNQAWNSGMLLFDGTYSTYPNRYGPHIARKFQQSGIGVLPSWSEWPDSDKVDTYFDYYRGDYLYDQLEVGADFENPGRKIGFRGFKRTHGGNTGHYLHPGGGSSPIHHSYRVNYKTKKDNQKLEASAGRFVTRSGLPDSTTNGLENDNILSAGLRYQRYLGNWTMNTYVGQFIEHRLVHHSSMSDSNYQDINRGRINIQFNVPSGIAFGLTQEYQQVSDNLHNRSLKWTKLYSAKSIGNLSLMGGVQILNSDDSFPFLWKLNYLKTLRKGFIQVTSTGFPNPKHPHLDDPLDKSSFEFWSRSAIRSGISQGGISVNGLLSFVQRGIDADEDEKILFTGVDIEYRFKKGWKVYSNVITQLDSSIYGGGIGTMIVTGLHGNLNLFKRSMKIDAHLWGNGTMSRFSSFGFDPIRHVPFSNTNSEWILPDKWLLHFEAKANVSGVIISYKINNILNAVSGFSNGLMDDNIWVRSNHLYPPLGRMMQFGITWHFNN